MSVKRSSWWWNCILILKIPITVLSTHNGFVGKLNKAFASYPKIDFNFKYSNKLFDEKENARRKCNLFQCILQQTAHTLRHYAVNICIMEFGCWSIEKSCIENDFDSRRHTDTHARTHILINVRRWHGLRY